MFSDQNASFFFIYVNFEVQSIVMPGQDPRAVVSSPNYAQNSLSHQN